MPPVLAPAARLPRLTVLLACATLTVALAGAPAVAAPPAQTPLHAALDPNWSAHVEVLALQARPAADWLQVTGRVTYDEDHTQHVTSPLGGRVTQVLVKPGDVVRVAQPLLALASPDAAQRKAELQKGREDLRSAEAGRRRARALLADGAISAREAAEAEDARDAAHVEALGLDLAKPGTAATLVARQAGVVTARQVFAGQELRPDAGEVLLTISNLDEVWIQADVYERDLAQVAAKTPVRARVLAYPGQDFAGEVTYVGDVVDAQARSVKVRCVVANRDRRLKPEMYATVWLQAQRRSALAVPSQAVIAEGETTSVLTVADGGALALRRVVLGPLQQGSYPVYEGLAVGERIVGRGALFVLQQVRESACAP